MEASKESGGSGGAGGGAGGMGGVGWFLVGVAFLAFVSLGLPDAVLGVAWPTMREEMGKAISYLGVVLASGSAGYVLSSFMAGTVRGRVGLGNVLLGSTVLVCLGLVGYVVTPVFAGVCAGAFVVGLGSGAIDSCLNAFVSERLPARYMSWLHGFYGVGATVGPAVMTWAVTSGVHGVGGGWRAGYAVLAGILGGMAGLFLWTRKAWRVEGQGEKGTEERATLGETIRLPAVWIQAGIFFVYCGIEVTASQWLYSLLNEERGRSETLSGMSVTAYWGLFTVGRFVLGALTMRVPQALILRCAMLAAPGVGVLIGLGVSPWGDLVSAALFGFVLAPIYPMLMSETAERVGARAAGQAIGLQVSAAVVGISVWPLLAGVVARSWGLEMVPVFLVGLCGVMVGLHEVGVWRGRRVTGHATNRGGGAGA